MENNYALVSSNYRYGINLNQILTNHLQEHGQVNDQGKLIIDRQTFTDDVQTDLTFALFGEPEKVKDTLMKFVEDGSLASSSVIGVTSLKTMNLNSDDKTDLENILDDHENDIARRRRLHQIITRDSDDQAVYEALVFNEQQFEQPVDQQSLALAMTKIQAYIQTALTHGDQGMIDKYRRDAQPFLSDLDEYTKKDYQNQAKRYKAIISLDAVERTRLNSLEQKLYDQHEFRSQLSNERNPQAFELLHF